MAWETGTVIIGTVVTTIIPARRINAANKSFMIYSSGEATFTSGVIEWSGDETHWGTASATVINTLGSDAIAFGYFTDSRPYWRVRGAVASGSVATCYWSVNY